MDKLTDVFGADFDPALLFYLLVLLIGVGSFFFGDFHNRLSRTFQHAVIWVLIFFGAVALFGMKDTIEAQLFPKAAVQTDGADILLTRAADGHFYATLTVNDAPIQFVVDTGATGIVLSKKDAERAGLKPSELAYLGRAQTANGEVATASVRLAQMVFAQRTDRNVRASVNAGDLDTSLLGMSYLSRFTTIEISGNKLRLIP